jgi:hypothetical protein
MEFDVVTTFKMKSRIDNDDSQLFRGQYMPSAAQCKRGIFEYTIGGVSYNYVISHILPYSLNFNNRLKADGLIVIQKPGVTPNSDSLNWEYSEQKQTIFHSHTQHSA